MKTHLFLLSLLFILTACSSVEPYRWQDGSADFSPYDWNDRKQTFLKESEFRVNHIENQLNGLKQDKDVRIALGSAREELKQLKYVGVRDWDSEKSEFIATMNELEENYERARQL